VDGAINIPVGEIRARAVELSGAAIATICESGFRSSLAASLLAREGLPRVIDVAGGMTAYRALAGDA
jgi:hydroxyacylglutathione hydrolase